MKTAQGIIVSLHSLHSIIINLAVRTTQSTPYNYLHSLLPEMGGGPAASPLSSSKQQQQRLRDVDHEYDDIITIQSSESDPDTVQVHLKQQSSQQAMSSSSSPSPASSACTLKYCKSACYIHPSSYSRDNVLGWIAISKRGKRDFLLSWIPDEMVRNEDKDKFVKVEIGDDGELDVGEEGE